MAGPRPTDKVAAWLASNLAAEAKEDPNNGAGCREAPVDSPKTLPQFRLPSLKGLRLAAGRSFAPDSDPYHLPNELWSDGLPSDAGGSPWPAKAGDRFHKKSPSMPGQAGDWVLKNLERECSGFLLGSVIAPPLALSNVERGGLDLNQRSMFRAMMQPSLASVLFTSSPISGALTKRSFQLSLLCLIPVWVFLCFYNLPSRSQPTWMHPFLRTREVRFVALELRDGTRAADMESPGIDSFGLARSTAPLSKRFTKKSTLTVVSPSEVVLTFPSEVLFDGWWLTTSTGDPSKDAVSFEVLAKLICDGGCSAGTPEDQQESKEWVRVGASGWYPSGMGRNDIFGTMATHRVPLEREEWVLWNNERTGYDFFNTIGIAISSPPLLVSVVASAYFDRISLAIKIFGLIFIGLGVWFLITGGIFVNNGFPMLAAFRLVPGVFWILMGLTLEKYQSWLLVVMLVLSTISLVGGMVEVFVFGYLNYFEIVRYLLFCAGLLVAIAYTQIVRRRILKNAVDIVRMDKALYDAAWEAVLRKDEAQQQDVSGIDQIEKLTSEANMRKEADPRAKRQLNRVRRNHGVLVRSRGPTFWLRRLFGRRVHNASLSEGSESIVSGALGMGDTGVGGEPKDLDKKLRPHLAPINAIEKVAMSALGSNESSVSPSRRAPLHPSQSFEGMMATAIFGVDKDDPDKLAVPFGTSNMTLDPFSPSVKSEAQQRGADSWPSHMPQEVLMGPEYFQFDSFRGCVDISRPITSLDQIYLQAAVLSPFFRAHVLALASTCNGLLRFQREVRDPRGSPRWHTTYEPWTSVGAERGDDTQRVLIQSNSDVQSDGLARAASLGGSEQSGGTSWDGISPERKQRSSGQEGSKIDLGKGGLVWAPLKSLKRASEKVVRNYHGDASFLTDICRDAIVFDSPEGIAACLLTLLEDPSFVIVQVRNNMSRHTDSKRTAGFRNVHLNLRIVTDTTTYLGVDTHVCELQLVLLDIINIKNMEGHSRYIQFRDARGE